jgi:hypothetical protein
MKYPYLLLSLLFIGPSCTKEAVAGEENGNGTQIIEPDYRNFYGIVWVGNNDDNLAYAKQMGYDYVFYHPGMADHANADSLKFYLETPQYDCYEREIDRNHPFNPTCLAIACKSLIINTLCLKLLNYGGLRIFFSFHVSTV